MLLGNSVDGLSDLVVEVVNNEIKEYEGSKENAWRSFFELILYSENSKREYQEIRNISKIRKKKRKEKEEEEKEEDFIKEFQTKNGIYVPCFAEYK